MLAIVDTHQHLWNIEQFNLPWLDSEGVEMLRKNHLMSDYLKTSADANVSKTVYMEVDVAATDRVAEANYVTELCQQDDNPMAGAVIGGQPGQGGFRTYISSFKDNHYIKGVRQVLHVPDTVKGHCLGQDFVNDIQFLGDVDLCFDLCLRPGELADAIELVDRCPNTRFILDHCGNADPNIINGASAYEPENPTSHSKEQWERDIATLGAREHVVCKISGIVARVTEGWQADTLAPTVNHCLDSFGPDRVIFGGDWPVCTLGAPFGAWAKALREIISHRPEEEQRQLLAENAERIYNLD